MLAVRSALMGLCALILLAPAGCSHGVTRPATTDVRLTVGIAPVPAGSPDSVLVTATVLNAGGTSVWHCSGCGCDNGMGFSVLGPDGKQVFVQDPRAPKPMCPDGRAALDPGGNLADQMVFNGTLYAPYSPTFPTPTYPAPPGTYTVVAMFGYQSQADLNSAQVTLERRATFVWQPQTP